MKDCLGCGYPPTHDDDPEQRMYEFAPLGSPLASVKAGLPAFQWGIDPIIYDWPWCPRWFAAFSQATIEGEDAAVYIQRAARYFDKGELSSLIEPPWTLALVELLDLWMLIDKAITARGNAKAIGKIRNDAAMRELLKDHAF